MPELPDEQGVLVISFNPVEQSVSALGRVLYDVDETALTRAVRPEARIGIERSRPPSAVI